MNNQLQKLLNYKYTSESGTKYVGLDFIELAKGNLKYAIVLSERVEWQSVETLIDEDLREGEIIEIEDQYVMTNGKPLNEILIHA